MKIIVINLFTLLILISILERSHLSLGALAAQDVREVKGAILNEYKNRAKAMKKESKKQSSVEDPAIYCGTLMQFASNEGIPLVLDSKDKVENLKKQISATADGLVSALASLEKGDGLINLADNIKALVLGILTRISRYYQDIIDNISNGEFKNLHNRLKKNKYLLPSSMKGNFETEYNTVHETKHEPVDQHPDLTKFCALITLVCKVVLPEISGMMKRIK